MKNELLEKVLLVNFGHFGMLTQSEMIMIGFPFIVVTKVKHH